MASFSGSHGTIKPSQMAAVAERRFDDAKALCDTGQNARANGSQYLAGIVIDILLKAKLALLYPAVARKRPHEVVEGDRGVWNLIWRSHDLSDMLDQMPSVSAALKRLGERAGKPYVEWLKGICEVWTIQIRYSARTSTIDEAREMLDRVRQLKEVLK